ncbi:MAG: MoxR family ATPase [Saprospiraceae bacterium]
MSMEEMNEPMEAQSPAWIPPQEHPELERLAKAVAQVRSEMGKVVVGQQEFVDMLIASLFAGGHVLVEGVPGIAKTLTAKLLARCMDTGFNRIQFTPDLMPSDVVGTTVFNMKTSDFTFNPGPVFSNIVLIDEINRAPAKTQAALFEVMEENQVTVDGTSHLMGYPFFVIATQNPIEQEGTYKLPEAQLDRFIIKADVHYPSLAEEQQILRRFRTDFNAVQHTDIQPVLNADAIRDCRTVVENIFIKDELLDYIAALVHETRENSDIYLGASPRASLAMMKMAKAVAAIAGRSFVTPDDIQYVAEPVLHHRIILMPEREMEGYAVKDVITDIIKKIPVPR